MGVEPFTLFIIGRCQIIGRVARGGIEAERTEDTPKDGGCAKGGAGEWTAETAVPTQIILPNPSTLSNGPAIFHLRKDYGGQVDRGYRKTFSVFICG